MEIAIVYDSSTGTTAKAAETMGNMMEKHGHQCRVQSVAQVDPSDVSEADIICVGSWVKGLFIIRQHPTEGTMQFIEQLGDLSGKNAIVSNESGLPSNLRFLPESESVLTPHEIPSDRDLVIVLDTSNRERVGGHVIGRLEGVADWINIDHHISDLHQVNTP